MVLQQGLRRESVTAWTKESRDVFVPPLFFVVETAAAIIAAESEAPFRTLARSIFVDITFSLCHVKWKN
jgi:hypothetical protein